MILLNYFDALEIFGLIDKLKSSESMSDSDRVLLSELETKLMLFKCPACGQILGAELNRKDWEDAWLKSWSDDVKKRLKLIGE